MRGRLLAGLAVVAIATSMWLLLRDVGGDESSVAPIGARSGQDEVPPGVATLPEAGAVGGVAGALDPSAGPDAALTDAAASARSAIEAAPALTLLGRVVDSQQQPIAGVTVIFGASRGDLHSKAWRHARGALAQVEGLALTAVDGRFEVAVLTGSIPATDDGGPQALRLALLHAALATRVVRLDGVVTQRFDTGDLQMEAGAVLTGRVISEAREPVRDADLTLENPVLTTLTLTVADDSESELARRSFLLARSTADGRFTVTGLRPGLAHLKASKHDVAETWLRDLHVPADAPLDVGDIVLREGFTLAGIVVGEDGGPIQGAQVHVQRPRSGEDAAADDAAREASGSVGQTRVVTASDADGRFRIGGLAPGRYDVHVSAAGRAWSRVFGVTAGSTDLRVVMPQLGTLLVSVIDADTSAPVARATLQATLPPGEKFQPWSDAQFAISADGQPVGRHAVVGVGPEGAELTVRAEGYVDLTQLAPGVHGQQTVPFEVRLSPELAVVGTFTDDAGVPVAGAVATVFGSDGRGAQSAPTDETGSFRVGGLEPGEWQLGAYAKGFADLGPIALTVPAGGLRDPLSIVLQRHGDIAGTVYDATGQPLAGARVLGAMRSADDLGWQDHRERLRDADESSRSRIHTSTADAAGRYAFTELSPGRYAVWIGRSEKLDLELGTLWSLAAEQLAGTAASFATVEPAKSARLDLHLPRMGTVHGRVSVDGVPAGGSQVVAVLADVDYRAHRLRFALPAIASPTGEYSIDLPYPARYVLLAVARDTPVPGVRTVSVGDGERVLADMALRGATMAVRVIDAAAGTPLAGVAVEVSPAPDRDGQAPAGYALWQNAFASLAVTFFEDTAVEPFHATTDADGRCVLRCLEPGLYTLWFDNEGYLEASTSFAIDDQGDPDELEIPMARGGRIMGTLRPAGLSPLPPVQLTLTNEGGVIIDWADIDGVNFAFEAVEPGPYEIRVLSAVDHDQVLGSRTVRVGAEAVDELVITLDP